MLCISHMVAVSEPCPALLLHAETCFYACAMLTGFERQQAVHNTWFLYVAIHPLRAFGALTMDHR